MDLNGYTITIQLADGTYTTSGVSVTTPIIGGSVVFKGNASNPSAVVFASTGSSFYVGCPYTIVVQDMTLAPSSGNALYADGPGSRINFSNIRFSGVGAGQYHMRYVSGGTISAMGNYEIVGGAPRHISGEINGAFVAAGITVTLTGTPAFSGEFILCSALASCSLFSVTYSGSATGKRYTINGNGVLNSYGAGTASTYFPGNSNGTTATGGQQL